MEVEEEGYTNEVVALDEAREQPVEVGEEVTRKKQEVEEINNHKEEASYPLRIARMKI